MKAVKAHLQEKSPEDVEAFEKGAQTFAKKIIANFKDYEFYSGESMNPDGMVALLVSVVSGVDCTEPCCAARRWELVCALGAPRSIPPPHPPLHTHPPSPTSTCPSNTLRTTVRTALPLTSSTGSTA